VIFIDTSAFLARHVTKDQHFQAANKFWDQILIASTPCCTTSFVVSETLTLLARRTSFTFAAERARSLYDARTLRILRPTERDEISAISLFQRYAGHSISFADCASFVIMRRYAIQDVFTFDQDFAIAGFQVKP
jgi:predicted nucleic acid-binding protein